ncbi:MAG: DMT family protein [Leptonema sp. (in: Bacteria)]|nr:DMT family protein [Leptonema sp. (in: bacteria)]
MKTVFTIGLLLASNIFMTIAWYGHLRFKDLSWFNRLTLPGIILISWSVAFFEYSLQIPANRIGFHGNGGPFTLWQLKVIQEAISLIVFMFFTIIVFDKEDFHINHLIGFGFLVLAVYFVFRP